MAYNVRHVPLEFMIEMLPGIHTKEKCDFLKHMFYSQINLFFAVCQTQTMYVTVSSKFKKVLPHYLCTDYTPVQSKRYLHDMSGADTMTVLTNAFHSSDSFVAY